VGCASAGVTSLPPTVRRVAVLAPYYRDAADTGSVYTDNNTVRPIGLTVGDVLAQQARTRLTEKGFDVIEPGIMKMATKNRVPTNTQMAAQILEEAHLDADRAVHRGTTLGTDTEQPWDESRWCDYCAGCNDGRSENRHGPVAGAPTIPAGSALRRRINRAG